MPESIREIYEYIVLGMLFIIFIISVRIFIMNKIFAKYFSSKKYRIRTQVEFEPLSNQAMLTITIYNKHINDTRISGLGYLYKNQTIDYTKSYLKQIDYSLDGKIIIPSRDSIKVKIEIDPLISIILDHNRGKPRVKALKCFATDSLGMISKVKTKTVRKVLNRKIKEALTAQRKEKDKELLKQIVEANKARRKQKEIKRFKRQEKWERFKLNTKLFIEKLKKKSQ